MFKNYKLPLLALIIAAGASAFTLRPTRHPNVDMYVFEFDPGSPANYTQLHVENESNSFWKYKGKNLPLCAGSLVKACRVAVIGAYVDNVTTPTALSGVTITGTASGTNVYYVSAITDPTNNQFSNKP